jgi:hypothetical protein
MIKRKELKLREEIEEERQGKSGVGEEERRRLRRE